MYRITFMLLVTLLTFSCKKKDNDNPSPTPTTSSCIYDFTKTTTTYVPITSPDGYYDGYNDLGTEGLIPIPFAFKVCGSSVTQFEADGNEMYFVSNPSEYVYIAYPVEGDNPSYISWKTGGAAGNRILKIQLEDKAGNVNDRNFQIWLYENGNKIEAHYGNNNSIDANQFYGFAITNETATTLKGIMLSGTTIDPVEDIYVGNFNSPVMYCLNNNSYIDAYVLKGTIANGLTYSFTPHN